MSETLDHKLHNPESPIAASRSLKGAFKGTPEKMAPYHRAPYRSLDDSRRSPKMMIQMAQLSGNIRIAPYLVAEWIHFTLFGIISPTIKLKVYTFGGL